MADYLKLRGSDYLLLRGTDRLVLRAGGATSGNPWYQFLQEGDDMLWMDVDAALSAVPVNIAPLIDDTDFKTVEDAVAYNAAGMDLRWNFVTTAGVYTSTAVTPTTGGSYDWTHQGDGMYSIEIPASGGVSINNDTEGFGWFSGKATGVLPWRGPIIGFRSAGANNALIDSAWSTTRGLAGTALPDAAADAAGGLPISDAGGLDMDARLDAAVSSRQPTIWANASSTVNLSATTVKTLTDDPTGVTTLLSRLTALRAGYLDYLNVGGPVASSAEVTGLNVNTRSTLLVPIEIETPDASTQVYKIRLHLYDEVGNMEAPDSTPTVTLTNAAGVDRSSRLSIASNPSAGVYTWDYTATAGDPEEQLVWLFSVVEGGATRTYPATSFVVEHTAYRFSSSDRATLNAILADTGTDIPASLATINGYVDCLPVTLDGSTLTAIGDTRIANLDATVSSRSTLTQAQVTGGSYAMNSASFAFNASLDFTTTQKAATLARVTLTDTLTTYSGNTPQSGDSFARIGANGASLSAVPWNAAWDAEVQSEVQDAIEVNHLDHLLAVDYDPASKPGVATALLNEVVENDGGVSRFTANSLEQAPSGGGGGVADWTSDERAAIRAILGVPASGTTPDNPSSGILDSIRDTLNAVEDTVDLIFASAAQPGSAMTLTSGERDAIATAILDLASAIDGKTLRQAMRYIAAVLAGKLSGAGTGIEVVKGLDGTTTRVTFTADLSGNRTGVTYD